MWLSLTVEIIFVPELFPFDGFMAISPLLFNFMEFLALIGIFTFFSSVYKFLLFGFVFE